MKFAAPTTAILAGLAALAPGLAQAAPSGFTVSAGYPVRTISPPAISLAWYFTRQPAGHGRSVTVTVRLWRSVGRGYGSTLVASRTGRISNRARSATFRTRARCTPYTSRRPPLLWFSTATYTVRGGHGAVLGTYTAQSQTSAHHCR